MKAKISFKDLTEAQNDALFQRLEAFESKARKAFINTGVAGAAEMFDSAINLGEVLRALPSNTREAMMKEYREIIGFDKALLRGTRAGAIKKFTSETTERNLGKFNVDLNPGANDRLNPLSVIYNRITLSDNYKTGKSQFGTNVIKSSHLKKLIDPVKIKTGKSSIVVFDTETASLGIGNVREIAAYQMQATVQDGHTVITSPTKKVFHEHLKTASMRLGAVYDKSSGKAMVMEEALQKQIGFNFIEGPAGDGQVFAKVTKDFLGKLVEADYVVGQNLQFDIGQIFQGVKKTSTYQHDAKYRGFIKHAESTINSKIVDTLELARLRLPDLDVAPEIRFGGAISAHSLENMLHETNLVDEIIKDLAEAHGGLKGGREEFLKKIGAKAGIGTVHAADVDTQIEGYLFKFLMEGKIKEQRLEDKAVKVALSKSYAPTPVTNIKNAGHIHPKVMKRLYDKDQIKILGKNDTTLTAREAFGDYDRMMSTLDSPDAPEALFRVTPVEQQMTLQRRLGTRVTRSESFDPTSGNEFARFAQADIAGQGFLNTDGTLSQKANLPGFDRYREFQRRAARKGDELAGLSLPERMVTEGMRRATLSDSHIANMLGPAESTGSALAGDMGVSYMKLIDEAYVGSSGAVSLPMPMLQSLEAQGIIKGTNFSNKAGSPMQNARVSVFRSAKGEYHANTAVDLGDENLTAVAKFFKEMSDEQVLEYQPHMAKGLTATRLASALEDVVGSESPNAVTFARLTGKAAETAHAVMAPFSNSRQIMSDLTEMTFRTTMLDSDSGIARLGAFVSDKLMTDGEVAEYDTMMRRTSARYNKIIEQASTGEFQAAETASRARVSVGRAGVEISEEGSRRAMAAANAVHSFSKKLPVIGAVLSGVLAASWGYNNFQERQEIDETFAFQGYEESKDYYNLQRQVEARTASDRNLDPLSTAGLIGNLHELRSNHTAMGPNANSHLFSGVI
jgi:DNA polymerase III epsilon subunit-like protein